jgi:hypothetical protein
MSNIRLLLPLTITLVLLLSVNANRNQVGLHLDAPSPLVGAHDSNCRVHQALALALEIRLLSSRTLTVSFHVAGTRLGFR